MRKAEGSKTFNSVQLAARILLKPNVLKISHFLDELESALGTGALPFFESLDSTTYKSSLLNLEEPLPTISTTLFEAFAAIGAIPGVGRPSGSRLRRAKQV
jgi:hypothetical protein